MVIEESGPLHEAKKVVDALTKKSAVNMVSWCFRDNAYPCKMLCRVIEHI